MKQKTVKQKATKHKNGKGPSLQRLIRGAALLLLLPLLAAGCGRDEDEDKIMERFGRSMDGVVLIEESAQEDGICMVYEESTTYRDEAYYDKDSPYLLLDRYVVEKDAERWRDQRRNYLEITNLVFTVYDRQSGEVYTITQEELEAAMPEELRCGEPNARLYMSGFFEYQGKWYLGVYTEYRDHRRTNSDPTTDTYVLVDLESGEMQTIQREAMWEMCFAGDEEYQKSMDIFYQDGFRNANGFWEHEISPDDAPYLSIYYLHSEIYPESDVVQITIESEGLPQQNKALYTKFPELEQYKGKEGYRAEMELTGKPGAEEVFRLFIEDGQEISFEGVTVPAKYATDGREHKVESFEDWDKWYSDENYRRK